MDERNRTYPLRMSPSMRQRTAAVAEADGISVNHFISLAIAEKLSRMEHDSFLRTQAAYDPNTGATVARRTSTYPRSN